jgi:hypothetical protein
MYRCQGVLVYLCAVGHQGIINTVYIWAVGNTVYEQEGIIGLSLGASDNVWSYGIFFSPIDILFISVF